MPITDQILDQLLAAYFGELGGGTLRYMYLLIVNPQRT